MGWVGPWAHAALHWPLYQRSGHGTSDSQVVQRAAPGSPPHWNRAGVLANPPARALYLSLQIFCQQVVKKNHLYKIKYIHKQININYQKTTR